MTNVSVIDAPPVGTQFIVDSVTVNSISQPVLIQVLEYLSVQYNQIK